jgi:hypothetical protein
MALAAVTGNGSTNPLPSLCATYGTNGLCSVPGSQPNSTLVFDGSTDNSAALQTLLASGDLNIAGTGGGGGTLAITSNWTIPAYRTIQCQPNVNIKVTGTATGFNLSNNNDTIIGCQTNSLANGATFIAASGTNDNVIGNAVPSSVATGTAYNITGAQDVFELNTSGNATVSTGSATHFINKLNNIGGTLTPAVPLPALSTGSTLQAKLWNVLTDLGATGTITGAGYTECGVGVGGCHGNGVSDDTATVNSVITGGNMFLDKGTYSIATGPINPTASRTIICAPGAQFYNPNTSSANTPMFQSGFTQASHSTVTFIGCQFYGGYTTHGGTGSGNYNELMEIASSQGAISQWNVIGGDFKFAAGDSFITYAANSSATSGPTDIALSFSTLFESTQPTVHLNGGQGIHILFDSSGNGDADPESDVGTAQVTTSDWANNYFYSPLGAFLTTGAPRSTQSGCTGRQNQGFDSSGCTYHNNVFDGSQTVSNGGTFYYPQLQISITPFTGPNGVTCKPGTYNGNILMSNGYASNTAC